jgi:hypothetical protein
VDLPARYAVRDYLKQQLNKYRTLTGDEFARRMVGWMLSYKKRPLSSDALLQIGEESLDVAKAAGAFGVTSKHDSGSSALPARARFSVSGFLLEPISLGQGWLSNDSANYTENVALLRTISGRFQRKKASFGVGMGCIVLTQHLLERVYERTEIRREELSSLIEAEFSDLIRALMLADAASLWIQRIEPGQVCRITAVPYSNGLMIANERMLFGDIEEGDFGFRWDIPGGEMQTPFVNPSRLLEDLGDGRFLQGNARPIRITCGVTYLDAFSLDREESDYFYGFRALMEEVGGDTLDALAQLTLAPLYAHQRADEYFLKDKFLPKTARLAALLSAGWLKTKPSQPVCVLLPYDADVANSTVAGV